MNIRIRHLRSREPLSLESAVTACAQSDDERSKEYIYKKLYGYIMAITIRYVKDEFDAEELTNESFIRAFNKIGSFKGSQGERAFDVSFRSWIGRIAVNVTIDFIRSKKPTTSLSDIEEYEAGESPIQTSSALDVADILALLNKLPEIQRMVFNLYEVEGYSHEEISQRLGIPESTSRTYLARGKQKLRQLYLATENTASNTR